MLLAHRKLLDGLFQMIRVTIEQAAELARRDLDQPANAVAIADKGRQLRELGRDLVSMAEAVLIVAAATDEGSTPSSH